MVNNLVNKGGQNLCFLWFWGLVYLPKVAIYIIYHPWIVWKIPFPFTTDVMASPWHHCGYPEMYFFLFLDPRDFRDTMGYPY